MSGCLIPLVVSEKSTLSWYRAFCQRFQVNPADVSKDGQCWPLEVWMGDGRIQWDKIIARIDYRDLSVVIHESPDLLTSFATTPPVDYDLECLSFDSYPEPSMGVQSLEDTSAHALPVRSLRTVWTCLTDVAHGADAKTGNVTMFRRHRTHDLLTGRITYTPFIAGNAIRGMLRDMVFNRFLALVGLKAEDLSPKLAHTFFSGGSIESGSVTHAVDVGAIRTIRQMVPPFDLWAGCFNDRAVTGRLRVHDAVLVCRENAWKVHPHMAPEMPLQDFAQTLQESSALTQLRLATRVAHRDIAESDGAQMIFNVETVIAGAKWVHSLQVGAGLGEVSEVSRSCLADLLQEFANVGVVGAQTSKLGLIEFPPYSAGEGEVPLPSPKIYLNWVKENAGAICEYLLKPAGQTVVATSTPAAKPARGKKAAASKAEVEEVQKLHDEGVL